ncbi:hypothetical protein CDO23_20605 (plasmid) [Sinorhizobium meliloti]|nr:hypothetical protein CDO23_20605 [Sinorhizobium meliloti]
MAAAPNPLKARNKQPTLRTGAQQLADCLGWVECGRSVLLIGTSRLRQLRSSRDWGRMPFLKYEQD